MGPNLKLRGYRDGHEVTLPDNLDAIGVETPNGVVYIELAEQVGQMVLVRAVSSGPQVGAARLILSPMQSGRIAIGCIKD